MPKKKEKGSKIFGSKLEVNKPIVPDQLEQLLTELEKKGFLIYLLTIFLIFIDYI